jgi:hypothetical protein
MIQKENQKVVSCQKNCVSDLKIADLIQERCESRL